MSVYYYTASNNYQIYNNTATSLAVNSTIGTGVISSNSTGIIINNTLNEDDIYRLFGIDIVNRKVNAQNGWTFNTPDGTVIELDNNGNIKVIDSDAKIIYRSNRIREFNKYINASDLLEDFIRFAGEHGAKQNNVLSIPIEIFINWLIVEASKFDGEPAPSLPVIPQQTYNRCLYCGRFIKASVAKMAKFCNPRHYEQYLIKL